MIEYCKTIYILITTITALEFSRFFCIQINITCGKCRFCNEVFKIVTLIPRKKSLPTVKSPTFIVELQTVCVFCDCCIFGYFSERQGETVRSYTKTAKSLLKTNPSNDLLLNQLKKGILVVFCEVAFFGLLKNKNAIWDL